MAKNNWRSVTEPMTDNSEKNTWNSAKTPISSAKNVTENNYAIENWYRAEQSGDPNAGDALLGASLSQKDFDNWEQWHKQNAGKLDVEYTFKSLDQDVLSRVADKYKSQWGDKQYYDMFDPDDAYRQQTGAMPKYLINKYDLNDPYDRYLYENNLPYRTMFNDMYSEAYKDYTAEKEEEAAYNQQYMNFQFDLYSQMLEWQQNEETAAVQEGRDPQDVDPESFIANLLVDPKYADVAKHFQLPGEDEEEPDAGTYDFLNDYLKANKKEPDERAFTVDDLMNPYYEMLDQARAEQEAKWWASLTDAEQRQVSIYRSEQNIESLNSEIDALNKDIARAQNRGEDASALISQRDEKKSQKKKLETDIAAAHKEDRSKSYEEYDQALLSMDINSDTREADLTEQLDDLKAKRDEAWEAENKARVGGRWEEYMQLAATREGLDKEITALSAQLNGATLEKSMATAMQNLEKYKQLAENPDFAANSVAPVNGDGKQDVYKDWDAQTRTDYLVLNDHPDGILSTDGNANKYRWISKYATDEEIATLNYIANTQGEAATREYMDALGDVLKIRNIRDESDAVEDFTSTTGGAIVGSVATVPMSIASAVEGAGNMLGAANGDGAIDMMYNASATRFRTGVRSNVSEQILANNSESFIPGVSAGQIWNFLYQTGMSMADTGARLPLGYAGLAVAGLDAASSTLIDQLESGATTNQALSLAAISGVAETLTEKIGLDNLFKPDKWMAGTFKQFILNTLKQGGVEASEEILSEIINIIGEEMIRSDESELRQQIAELMKEKGISQGAAYGQVIGLRLLEAGLGGFVSGLFFGAGGQVVTIANTDGGMKTLEAYNEAKRQGKALSVDLNIAFTRDIMTLGLSDEATTQALSVKDAYANQPMSLITSEGHAILQNMVNVVNEAARTQNTQNKQRLARQVQARSRLNSLYQQATALRNEAASALERGDIAAQTKAIQQCNDLIKRYTAAYDAESATLEVENAKAEEQRAKTERKVLDAVEKAANHIPLDVEYQRITLTRLEDLAELRDELAISEMSLEELDADLAEGNNYAIEKAADAMARRDVDAYNMWEDAVNYKDNPKDTENHLSTNENGDNFNVINEMVNGGESNETVQAKGETNAETGRDRVSRAERVRGSIQGDRNQSREDRRKLDTVGKETRGTRRAERGGQAVTWGVQQDNDCRNAVAAFNRKNGTTLRENSVRQARNVPGYANTFARIVKRITGRDSFFIESDSNLFGGFTTRGRQYVVLTGDIVLDAFNLFHENGHNMPSLLNAIYNALDNGDIPKSDFDAYIRYRRANLAAKRGVSEDEISLGSREHLRNEFACDMFGCYGAMEILEVDRWGDYGISSDTIPVIKNAITEALSSGALSETDAETADREYREVYSKGAAIAENDAQFGYLNDDLAESSDIANVETNGNGDVLAVTSKTGNTLFSENTWNNGGKSLFERTLYANGYTEYDVERAVEYMQNVVNFLRNLGETLGYDRLTDSLDASVTVDVARGKAILHTLLPNGDYPVNFDLSTICKKRVAAQRVLNALVQRGVFNRVIYNSAAIARVNDILQERGFETACAACFVEARRMQIQKWAETFCEKWNEEVDKRVSNPQRFGFGYGQNTITADDVLAIDSEIERGGKKNPKGNLNLGQGSVQVRMGRLLDRVPTLARHIQVADLVTPNGLTELRKYSSDMFSFVKSLYGAANPKIVQEFEAYNGDAAMLTFSYIKDVVGDGAKGAQQYVAAAAKELGLKKTDPRVQNRALRDYLYDIGGARSQSFSDFIIENVLDKMQLYADLAAKRLPLHEYTKEIASARIFGLTGAKTNLSIIHQIFPEFGEEHAGLIYKDGKWTYVASDYENSRKTGAAVQSIGWKDAVALQNDPRYSPNVGTIAIGFSDHHIEVMLDDANIRMIIPYHKSGLPPEFALKTNVAYATDYTDMQNTTVLYYMDADGNRISADDLSGAKVDTSFLFNKTLRETGDARAAAQKYLEWCAEKHPVNVKSGAYKGQKVYAVFKPKFSGGEIGGVVYKDFTTHPNYYKMLEDFSTYDGDTPSMQGAVTLTYPSKENALKGEQLEAYKAKLRDTGIFTEVEIEKYAKVAQMSLEELIEKEMRSRQAYNAQQDAVFDETVDEIESMLEGDFARDEPFMFSENAEVKSFKRQDEAIQANRRTVAAMGSVCDLTGNEFAKSEESFKTRVSSFFTEHGNEAYNPELGMIRMTDTSVNDDLAHGYGAKKITTFAAIPDVIKHGRVVDYADNWKQRGYDTAMIAAPITIGGKPYFVGCRVMRRLDVMSQRYYIHEVIALEENKLSEAFTSRFSTEDGVTRASDSSSMKIVLAEIARIKRDAESSQFNFSENAPTTDSNGRTLTAEQQEYFKDSKVRDENGNLQPVFHGTPSGGFTEFKLPDTLSTLMSAQGAGFYFTDKRNAEQYTKAVNKSSPVGGSKMLYETYLNITNPLEIKPYERTITEEQFKDIIRKGNKEWFRTNWMASFADGAKADNQKLEFDVLLDKYVEKVFSQNHSDDAILAEMTRAFKGGDNTILNAMRDVLGYDGVRFTDRYGDIWVAWSQEQIKDVNNTHPTDHPDIRFSENAPTKRQSRLNDAWQLYDDGYNPTEYYASNPQGFDLKTSNLLRGLMLRNGENVGGALSDANMDRITDIFSRANKRHAIGLTISSPVRVFEDVTGWGGSTAEERAQNVRDGNYLKNTYYEYGNVQAANRETWISEKMRPVIEAVKNNGEYGALESSVTQMLGEGIITEEQAKNAVTDGKTMIIEAPDGVFVLDGKSRLLYSSDGRTSTEYTEEYRERVKRAIRAGKGNRVNAFMTKPKTTKSPLRVTRNGNTVTVKDASGKVVAEVTNGTNPNMKAVNAAVDALRTFYADAYKEISNVRLENGYAPPGYIENYFPHQSRTYDGVEGFIDALTANDLPTGINGMTGTFSPGQPWNANLQTRLGTYTEFDAIRGFNRYVNGAGDTIFYTPVIQRLRQLEKAIRTQGANALTEEDAKRNSAFVDWLHEYANEWANKKSSFDRGAESIFGREAYSVSQMLTKMVSASAVGGNVSSAMSNIISGLTGYAQIDAKYTVPEIVRTVGQLFQLLDKKGQYDGFADKIPFLKRRFSDNEDILIQNVDKLKRKGSKALYAMFSAIDRFAVESVARAKYSECMANGMTDVQAIAATNDMLIKNFSDRGKGQAARVFNVKWLRPVAQFQLEVLNQMNHFRDMDRAEVEAKLADLEREYAGGIPFDELEAKALSSGGYRKLKKELAYLVLLSLWGIITRGLLGRDQTWNPYGMAKDAVDDIQEGGIKQAGEGIMEAVIDNAPFLSVLSGGGRVPIAGNLSYVTDILEAVLNGETEKLTNADWIKGGTAFVPGGGQLRKTLTGIDANAHGGSYTNDGKLRYPITNDEFWRSAVFGPSAVAPDGYEWGDSLSKKDTEVYQELVDEGYDQADLYDILLNYGGSSNAEKALSLLANRNDFSDEELDVIAEAVGLNYKGSLEQYAEKEANKYLKKKQKELDEGDISQERYDEIENVFDEYFRLLGMDN